MQLTRFAVPFFFLVSGYFWARGIRGGKSVELVFSRPAKRVMMLFAVWSLVYLLVPDRISYFKQHGFAAFYAVPAGRIADARMADWLLHGTSEHLWFLLSLAWALTIATVLIRLRWQRLMLPIAGALYVVGLLGGAYSATAFGIDLGLNTRDGPFFSLIFFAMGWYFADENVRLNSRVGWALTVGGIALQSVESLHLYASHHLAPTSHDYLFGTLAFGVGVMTLTLANPSFGSRQWVSKLSTYTLGVYVCHVLFIGIGDNLVRLANLEAWRQNAIADAVFALVVLAASIGLSKSIAVFPRLRPLVT